jgi:iron complex outermembrane receptor protein
MIDSVSLPQFDFERIYFNIDKAHINGFELQVQKNLDRIAAGINYTYLDHKNEGADRPLDALPNHTLTFDLHLYPAAGLRVGFLGQAASTSDWFDYDSEELWEIPSYFNLDVVVGYRILNSEVFLKMTNLFNSFIYTEPVFPWRGRYFEIGFKADIFGARD